MKIYLIEPTDNTSNQIMIELNFINIVRYWSRFYPFKDKDFAPCIKVYINPYWTINIDLCQSFRNIKISSFNEFMFRINFIISLLNKIENYPGSFLVKDDIIEGVIIGVTILDNNDFLYIATNKKYEKIILTKHQNLYTTKPLSIIKNYLLGENYSHFNGIDFDLYHIHPFMEITYNYQCL